jgi:hypothetical protein
MPKRQAIRRVLVERKSRISAPHLAGRGGFLTFRVKEAEVGSLGLFDCPDSGGSFRLRVSAYAGQAFAVPVIVPCLYLSSPGLLVEAVSLNKYIHRCQVKT